MEKLYLWPIFIQITLTMVTWYIMGKRRISGFRNKTISKEQLSTLNLASLDEYYIVAGRNFDNQFQLPIIFILALIIAIQFNVQSTTLLILAAIFVSLRVIHSWIHLTSNKLKHRFATYFYSSLCVWFIWLLLALKVAI